MQVISQTDSWFGDSAGFVRLKNKSSIRRMGKKSLRFNFLFENLYILLNIRIIV
jgi:hypothetical protein